MKPGEWMCTIAISAIAISACGNEGDNSAGGQETSISRQDSIEALREARADSVARAEALYDEAAFDSIVWRSDQARFERGENVWSFSCSDCHGPEGRGNGPDATRFEYDMPDFELADWEYAGDLSAIRHRVFVGHESEMPTWGLYGLTHRDVDAVAYYVDQRFGQR